MCPPLPDQVYAETFPAVWRMVRRMGVIDSAVDDVVQEDVCHGLQKARPVRGGAARSRLGCSGS